MLTSAWRLRDNSHPTILRAGAGPQSLDLTSSPLTRVVTPRSRVGCHADVCWEGRSGGAHRGTLSHPPEPSSLALSRDRSAQTCARNRRGKQPEGHLPVSQRVRRCVALAAGEAAAGHREHWIVWVGKGRGLESRPSLLPISQRVPVGASLHRFPRGWEPRGGPVSRPRPCVFVCPRIKQ